MRKSPAKNKPVQKDWAKDIAAIVSKLVILITDIVAGKAVFANFATEIRKNMPGNMSEDLSEDDIIEMFAQYIITKPVFDALFADYDFAKVNLVSIAMQEMMIALEDYRLDKETDALQAFYDDVRLRAQGIKNAADRQKILNELYNDFFSKAFPRMTQRLGIVYTPDEVVDFIIHSVDHILKTEFGETFGSEGVHILDPFTGTGTFITRLLQSGLMTKEEIQRKYKTEIHANEIVPLACYIAGINIEAAYHEVMGGDYVPFDGIHLTDTFADCGDDSLQVALDGV